MSVLRWVAMAAAVLVAHVVPALAEDAKILAVLPQSAAPAIPLPAPDSLAGRLAALLNAPGSLRIAKADADDFAGARSYYAGHGYAPLWVSDTGLNSRAGLVAAEIARAGDWGLDATDFILPSLPAGGATPAPDNLTAAELTLTRAVLKYGRYARGGRIPDPSAELSSYLDRKPQLIAPDSILSEIAFASAPDAYLKGLNPQHMGFEYLRQALLKARDEQSSRTSINFAAGPLLVPGKFDPRVKALRARLNIPAAPESADVYDPALVEAVKAFQKTNGLRPDGFVGDRTRQVLNGPSPANLIPRLLANMEEWRWMPANLGATHVEINVPEFQMRLVKNGAPVHTERVVTGKPESSTPIFSQDMQTVVFQPKWGVPDSIKINELLPRLQQGGGLRSGLRMTLNGHDIDPWRVDWSRADITRYSVYQPSGEDNALGVVKFLFPNKHAVYLHDTPSKSLFNASTRAYSHGCIRVRNPVKLAELVLGDDKGWSNARVRELVEDGPEDNQVKLDTKIPVHVTYFTAVADANGNVQTYPDIYGHEKRITQALQGRFDQIAKLEPPKLDPMAAAARYAAAEPGSALQAIRNQQGLFVPPSALGYNPTPPPPLFQLFSGKSSGSSGSSGGRNYRGNSSNDVIMRQLGGF